MTNLDGRQERLFARFDVKNPQHEYEVTELILAASPDAYKRGIQVGNQLADAELLFGQQVVYLERERTRKSLDKVKQRIRKYDGTTEQVLWVVDTETRLQNILDVCQPPDNHKFTTYRQAVEDFWRADIWITY